LVEPQATLRASLAHRGFEKRASLDATLLNAVTARVEVGEGDLRRNIAFANTYPEKIDREGNIPLAMIAFQDSASLLKFFLAGSTVRGKRQILTSLHAAGGDGIGR